MEKHEDQPVESTMKGLVRELEDMVRIDTLRDLVHRQPQQQAPQPQQPQQSPMGVKLDLDLGEIFKAQQAAAQAASEAKDAATKAYFEAQTQRLEDMYKRLSEAGQPKDQAQPRSVLEVWREVNQSFKEMQNEMGIGVASGVDAATLIQLKKMELEQARWLQEQREASAQRNLELQIKLQEHDLKVRDYVDKQGRGQRIWDSFLKGAGQAVEEGVRESQGSPHKVANTPGGMEVIECPTEGCGFKIPVPPQATLVTCPKCQGQFDVNVESD